MPPRDEQTGPREFRLRLDHESLDASSAPMYDDLLRKQLREANTCAILDLTLVRFADSVGLGFLVRLNRLYPNRIRLAGVGGPLLLCFKRVGDGLLPKAFKSVTPLPGATVWDFKRNGMALAANRSHDAPTEFAYVHPDS